LDNINAEAIRLSHLINDLLALARTDEGKAILKPEAVRLDQLIAVVALHAEVMAMKHHITIQIHTPEPLVIMGDEGRLIQMIMNLLDNAIIYTNASGQVTITLEKKDASACIIIHDTGIGIAPEHIPSIFERFYRVDPARVRTDTNNSGLGLAIVEWVIHAHGGSITVESQIGQGSTFVVTLPLKLNKAGSTSHEKA
jgi:signal transduction histidine kinase